MLNQGIPALYQHGINISFQHTIKPCLWEWKTCPLKGLHNCSGYSRNRMKSFQNDQTVSLRRIIELEDQT